MLKALLSTRRFAPLFWCQFFSAFNDNMLKNGLVALIVYVLVMKNGEMLVQIAGAVFILPSFLLSGLGGQLADRYDKALIAKRLKFAEVFAAAMAAVGFYLHAIPGLGDVSIVVLMVALGMFGAVAALFGPIKYGILPDHLKTEELPGGNALIEGATFLAILLGTVVGTQAMTGSKNPIFISLLIMVFAIACWLSARKIPSTRQAAPDLVVQANIFASTFGLMSSLYRTQILWRGALVVAWFWMVGAVTLPLLATLVKNHIGGSSTLLIVAMALFSIGIAIGSLLAAWMAHGRIILLPTPVAAILMGVFGLDLGLATYSVAQPGVVVDTVGFFTTLHGLRVAVDLLGFAIAGGLYVVPIFSAIQVWAGQDRRARVIAGVNVLSSGFMVAGALTTAGIQSLGVTEPQVLIGLGVLNVGAGFLIFRMLPIKAFQDFLSIIYRAVFRMEIRGLENVSLAGPNAIIALNHVSFLDAGLALSLTSRDPVFAIDSGIAKRWWVRPFLHLVNAMPLDPTNPMATRTLINAVKSGQTLIIFPEGRLTVTGSLMKVYDGAGLIADKSGAQVLPVRIDGLQVTPFSRLSRDQVRRRWFPKVIVTVLQPVKLTVSSELRGKARRQAAGAALYGVMSDLVFRTTPTDRSIIDAVIAAAHEHGPSRIAVDDPVSGGMSYRKLLTSARVMGEKLMPLAKEGEALGVMLPNANGAAVTVLAVMSAGRVPAMINFSAGATNILAACRGALVRTILTSRLFVEKARLGGVVEAVSKDVAFVYLEDLRGQISTGDKLRGLLGWKKPLVSRQGDDRGAILFTSGSEGTPKGVVLSNRNMLTNAAQSAARIDFGRTDIAFNVLPVFHSFGLTVGLILPLVTGLRVYLYPSPLHYRVVPVLVYGVNATLLFGTDTFLAGYAKAAHAYDFRSLRYVLAGAERLKESTRHVWMEKFGIRILEGYGVTETAPALALNTPMFNRFGTVGRILPGMTARLESVPGVDEGGRLYVSGPNIMMGYLRAENPGLLEPPEGGWHDTGDIVTIDKEGFITIRGRAKRFAKIGGEMISLAAVEAIAADAWPEPSAVAAIPDQRKGERIVLLTESTTATRSAFLSCARARGASEMMVPAEVVPVKKLPLLGSGKIDYATVSKIARELTGQVEVAG